MGVMSLIIPAYNEADRIVPMLSDLCKVKTEYPGFLHEVIVVDDGSKDATVERVLQYVDRLPLRVLRKENGGKWSAIRVGLHECKGTIICIMDADGSIMLSEEMWLYGKTPDHWVRFAEKLRDPNMVVVGSRFHQKSRVEGKSLMRRVVSRGYKIFVRASYRYATGRKAPEDMQCPYKVIHAANVLGKLEFLTSDRFAGDIELLFVVGPKDIMDVPCHFRHMRGSKVKAESAWQMFRETVRLVKREKYMNKFISNDGGVVRASGADTKTGLKGGKP